MPSSKPQHASRAEPLPRIRGLRIVRLDDRHLDQVLEIERASFPTPWPRKHFLFEIREHRYAHNVALLRGEEVLAYACVWFVYEEVRINNIAVRPGRRERGLASRLLRWILREGTTRGCERATLEVRPSNLPALRLYRRHGFRVVGRRKDYYSDTHEDALLMEAPIPPSGEART